MAHIINIYGGSKNWIEAMLSNFAHTPFVLDDQAIASVEAFHQGIKYKELARRLEIFSLWGVKAKSAGREANRLASGFVYWGEPQRTIVWQSAEYYELYFRALHAKFTQDDQARAALLASGEALFSHVLPDGSGLPTEAFQSTHLCQSLYQIRSELSGSASSPGN